MFWLSLNNLAVSRENTRGARTEILTRVHNNWPPRVIARRYRSANCRSVGKFVARCKKKKMVCITRFFISFLSLSRSLSFFLSLSFFVELIGVHVFIYGRGRSIFICPSNRKSWAEVLLRIQRARYNCSVTNLRKWDAFQESDFSFILFCSNII